MAATRTAFFLCLAAACLLFPAVKSQPASAVSEPVEEPFLLGLNPLYGGLTEVIAIHDGLGANATRILAHWRYLEPAPGRYEWQALDETIGAAGELGLEPVVLVAGAPQHACRDWQLTDQPDRLCAPEPEAFAGFLEVLVARYSDRVTYWEVWNEPDQDYQWEPRADLTEYAALLEVSYPVIKTFDAESVVIMAAMANGNIRGHQAVLELLAGDKVFDALAVHPYRISDHTGLVTAAPGEERTVDGPDGKVTVDLKAELLMYQDLLLESGRTTDHGYLDVPVILTEFGWPALEGCLWYACVTLQQQANYLRETVTLLRTDPDLAFVRGLLWFADFDWSDDPTDQQAMREFGFFGLLRVDGTPKPAAIAFRELAVQ